jgi:hypothetical protein
MSKGKDDRQRLRELQKIPGVGPRIAQDLLALDIRSVSDLKGRDPERLYVRLNTMTGHKNDPCLLYAFRCAVYFASSPKPEPELLKWWAWKEPRKA